MIDSGVWSLSLPFWTIVHIFDFNMFQEPAWVIPWVVVPDVDFGDITKTLSR